MTTAPNQATIERIGPRERQYVEEVLAGGFATGRGHAMSPRFEQAFAELIGTHFAISFVNGTATLHGSLVAAGVEPGDEVIVPPLTMASTTLAVLHANAVPVFADIDPDTFQIDVASVRERITPRTKAVIPVALYGLGPDMDGLMQVANDHSLAVIEDVAQAVLARDNGRILGSIGTVGSFSLQSSKHLTAGEGGVVTTDDPELADRLRRFNTLGYAAVGAAHGAISKADIQDPDYSRHVSLGFNYRMPELCAAVGLAQVERAEELVGRRVAAAKLLLDAVSGCDWLVPQQVPEGREPTWWAFVCRLADPDIGWHAVRDELERQGADLPYGAWKLTYMEPMFADEFEPGICPVAESVQPRLMQFPTNYWDWSDAERQADALRRAIEKLS